MVEGILVFVYRKGYGVDCSNGGITSVNNSLMLYSGNRDECIKQAETDGYLHRSLYLNKRILWGEKYYFAEPLVRGKGAQMFGGNYVCTADSRFHDMVEDYRTRPLPVHDRYEVI